MTTKKIFFDANIFNDIFDDSLPSHSISKEGFALSMQKKYQIYNEPKNLDH